MDVLRKIRAATLVETLTASVLIVIVFMVASLILNNIFSGTIKRDISGVQSRVKELHYLQLHEKIKVPYSEDFGNWQIDVIKEKNNTIIRYSREGVEKELVIDKIRE